MSASYLRESARSHATSEKARPSKIIARTGRAGRRDRERKDVERRMSGGIGRLFPLHLLERVPGFAIDDIDLALALECGPLSVRQLAVARERHCFVAVARRRVLQIDDDRQRVAKRLEREADFVDLRHGAMALAVDHHDQVLVIHPDHRLHTRQRADRHARGFPMDRAHHVRHARRSTHVVGKCKNMGFGGFGISGRRRDACTDNVRGGPGRVDGLAGLLRLAGCRSGLAVFLAAASNQRSGHRDDTRKRRAHAKRAESETHLTPCGADAATPQQRVDMGKGWCGKGVVVRAMPDNADARCARPRARTLSMPTAGTGQGSLLAGTEPSPLLDRWLHPAGLAKPPHRTRYQYAPM
ncbi:MAG TPA: hypothetical protein PK021_09485 [Dokdonella sp.]|nr:hypothetical protein [Dokdonella sp.]